SLLPVNMMTREVSELLVISTHLVEQAVARSRRARRNESAVSRPKHVDNRIVQVFVVQDQRYFIHQDQGSGYTSDRFWAVEKSLYARCVDELQPGLVRSSRQKIRLHP